MKKIIFFDTETTGLPKSYNAPISNTQNWPRMVQLAFIEYFEDGTLAAEHNYIIKPEGFSIPTQTSNIHRITTERANAEGRDLQEVLTIFNNAVKESVLLVAHNFDFDKCIIGAELFRKSFDTNVFMSKRNFCTMKNKNVIDFCKISGNYGYKWPKLDELHYKLFQKRITDAHDASIDIRATANCFWELLKRGVVKA